MCIDANSIQSDNVLLVLAHYYVLLAQLDLPIRRFSNQTRMYPRAHTDPHTHTHTGTH